ncbi:E3 ubiquitin-protein ligase TRIM71-like [Mercenaria mercenaria]|uniref:E3 ubiquitin-protein ligase TRIM71-like n=1 Tax=Mercenaria mercenaria TaxID=6596 RepID=UPI00234E4309|nr:E3 ubiquitin-protein ligase TRIM71-like [Mercenaria mercenaria]
MAEGYKSVFNTSEEIYDFYCSPCLEEKRNNEAEKYCTSCKLYYCKSCLRDHNKFPALKFHKIKDVLSITAGNVPQVDSRATSLTEPCEHHPDEIVKMYCGKHDVVCCTVCIALDHRECKAVDYIPKLAKDIGKSTAYTDFMKDMRKVKLEYERTKQAIEEEIQNMTDVKEDIIKDIKRYKLEVVAKLGELERKSIDRVNERYKLITEKMNAIATKVAECLGKVTTHLQESESKSEAEKFVRMKKMKERKMAEMDISLQNVEALSFSLDRRFQSVLDETDTLVKVDTPVEVTLKRKYNISFKNDTSTCSVSDICILNDDTVVLADIDSLKRLDRSFSKLEKLDITGQPFGICRTSYNEFAVTLRVSQKVQFVS